MITNISKFSFFKVLFLVWTQVIWGSLLATKSQIICFLSISFGSPPNKTNLPLENYRNDLHNKYNRNYVKDNSFSFSPHITFLKIQDSKVFKKHRENIENIIN